MIVLNTLLFYRILVSEYQSWNVVSKYTKEVMNKSEESKNTENNKHILLSFFNKQE